MNVRTGDHSKNEGGWQRGNKAAGQFANKLLDQIAEVVDLRSIRGSGFGFNGRIDEALAKSSAARVVCINSASPIIFLQHRNSEYQSYMIVRPGWGDCYNREGWLGGGLV